LVQNAVLTARHAVLGTLAGFAGALGLPLVADSEAYAAAANQRSVASTRCACGCLHRHQHARESCRGLGFQAALEKPDQVTNMRRVTDAWQIGCIKQRLALSEMMQAMQESWGHMQALPSSFFPSTHRSCGPPAVGGGRVWQWVLPQRAARGKV